MLGMNLITVTRSQKYAIAFFCDLTSVSVCNGVVR